MWRLFTSINRSEYSFSEERESRKTIRVKDEYHPIISNEDWAFFNAQFAAHRGGFSRCSCPYPYDKPSMLCTYNKLSDLKFSIDVSIKCLDRVLENDHAKIVEFANKLLKLLKEYGRHHMSGYSYSEKVRPSVLMKRGKAYFNLGRFEDALDDFDLVQKKMQLRRNEAIEAEVYIYMYICIKNAIYIYVYMHKECD
jgi:tetratricopeptide (TPR) repeat protein